MGKDWQQDRHRETEYRFLVADLDTPKDERMEQFAPVPQFGPIDRDPAEAGAEDGFAPGGCGHGDFPLTSLAVFAPTYASIRPVVCLPFPWAWKATFW